MSKSEEEEMIWNGEDFVPFEEYIEQVKEEKPENIGVLRKQELARAIIKEIFARDVTRISGSEYDLISKKVKRQHNVFAGPSLAYMQKKGWLVRVDCEGRRAFYVVSQKGAEFSEFGEEEEQEQ